MLASEHSTDLSVYSFSYVDRILVVIIYIALLQVLVPHHCMSYPKYQTINEIRSIQKNIGLPNRSANVIEVDDYVDEREPICWCCSLQKGGATNLYPLNVMLILCDWIASIWHVKQSSLRINSRINKIVRLKANRFSKLYFYGIQIE